MLALARKTAQSVQQHYTEFDRRLKLERDHSLPVEIDFLSDRPCTLTDPGDPLVRAAHWATHRITATEPEYGGVQGATDGTFLWSLKKIPIVTMGAGARHVAHQVDEWVDLDQLVETARIYALTALEYLKPRDAV
jgi:succinyl-diaminopimelate desuccinylase